MVEIENKSLAIETAVIELINKFLVHIEEPHLQENKFDWLDSERAVRPISSSSKLIGGLEAGE